MDGEMWYPFKAGTTLGETGSEDGIILRDEEYSSGARITLERDVGHFAPFAITCGIYGWMVHTRFFTTEQEANEAFEAMKAALARIVGLIPLRDSPLRGDPQANERVAVVGEEIQAFIETFP
jgi:hypothetical protein